ncbi:MAG TPA: hypothetical protein DEP03_05340 [Massilia sp.]|nr:hypothetical protein [Massilia sp.]
MKERAPQFLIYVVGGLLSALVDIGLMQILIANQQNAFVATSAGFVAGLCVNYAYHAKVTFKNDLGVGSLARYLCVVGANYLLTLGLVGVSLALFDNALIGKIVSLPVVAANGFLLSKIWIFK